MRVQSSIQTNPWVVQPLLSILIANKILSKEVERRTFFTNLQKNESFKIWKGESFPFSKESSITFYEAIKSDIDWIVDKFSFSETALRASDHKRFSLSKNDIENIYQQLKTTGLIEQNEALIAKTLKPYSL